MKRFRSIAVWPKGSTSSASLTEDGHPWSDDIHDTEEQAHAVCRALRRHGMGGEGKVFPVRTSVEPVAAAMA